MAELKDPKYAQYDLCMFFNYLWLHRFLAIVYVCTSDNMSLLIQFLKIFFFSSWNLCFICFFFVLLVCGLVCISDFSNMLTSSQLEQLAHADEHEIVRQVQEVYADYLALDHHLMSLNVIGCLSNGRDAWRKAPLQRTTEVF